MIPTNKITKEGVFNHQQQEFIEITRNIKGKFTFHVGIDNPEWVIVSIPTIVKSRETHLNFMYNLN